VTSRERAYRPDRQAAPRAAESRVLRFLRVRAAPPSFSGRTTTSGAVAVAREVPLGFAELRLAGATRLASGRAASRVWTSPTSDGIFSAKPGSAANKRIGKSYAVRQE